MLATLKEVEQLALRAELILEAERFRGANAKELSEIVERILQLVTNETIRDQARQHAREHPKERGN